MRKKCTNSSCRRMFTVEPVNKVSCPYCGRVYPRILPVPAGSSVQTNWSVVLYSTSERKLPTIKVIRMLTGLGLKDAKAVGDNAPSIIRTGLSITEAFRMERALEETGASAAAEQLTKREALFHSTA